MNVWKKLWPYIIGFIIAFALSYQPRVHATTGVVVTWDRTLSYPPQMTAEQLARADIEVLPENWNRTYIALASDHGQKMPDNGTPSGVIVELGAQHYVGASYNDSFTGTTLYVEVPFAAEDYSLWGTLYYDKVFQGVYAGLAKRFGNWQLALGAGTVWDDNVRRNVINPWAFYASDEYEALLHAEYYLKKDDEPWFYKGYIQKKLSDEWLAGIYGEKDFGIGPMVTWKVAKSIKLWATIPVAQKPYEDQMKLLVGVKFVYE